MTPRASNLAASVTAALAAAHIAFRQATRTWGASYAEAEQPLPGDELVPNPVSQATMAVTIDAPLEAVWPWLVQMGVDRAGLYTHTWVENGIFRLQVKNADRIVPEWQHMDLGDAFPLGKNAPSLRVEAITPERELVLAYPDGTWSWAFVLVEPLAGERTRLITRNRAPARTAQERLRLEVMLPGAFLMMRKMLLGIKERAERLAAEQRQLSPSEASGAPAAQLPATPVAGQAA